MIPLAESRSSRARDNVNESELSFGLLHWFASQTRPDVCYDALEMRMIMKSVKVLHLSQANKIVKKVKGETAAIVFPRLAISKISKLFYFQMHHMPT